MDALIFGNALMEKSFHSYQKISLFFSRGKEQALLYHEKKGIKSNKILTSISNFFWISYRYENPENISGSDYMATTNC